MRTSRRVPVLLAVSAALVLSSFAQQSSKGKSAENATVALLQLHSAYQQASPAVKPQLLLQARNAAAQRQQLLSSLIQTNPADVLRIAIPNNIRSTMAPAVQPLQRQSPGPTR